MIPISSRPAAVPNRLDGLRGVRVLVTSEETTDRREITGLLKSWAMEPRFADSASAARSMLDEARDSGHPYRLVLMDDRIPGMEGPPLWDIAAVRLRQPVDSAALLFALSEALATTECAGVEASTRKAMPSLRILIAEDNLVNQKVVIAMLKRMGHEVVVAANGMEAIEKWRTGQFDTVFMDAQMPELDGLEATRRIRAEEQSRGGHVPIIAMTACAMVGDRELCLDAGMDDYISKPIRGDSLEQVIARCCGASWNS